MIIRNKDLVRDGISPKLLKGCIAEHQKTIERFRKLDDYYVGNHGILNRKKVSKHVPNNKIVGNFPKYITDTAVGYMFGNAITYQTDNPEDLDDLKLAHERADVDTHDAELGKDKPEAEASFAMMKNKATDKKQFEKYTDILGENAPESFTEFQKLNIPILKDIRN